MAKKKTTEKPAKKAAKPKAKVPTAKPKAKAPTRRQRWFDENSHEPLIEKYARQLDSFIQTMADGIVEDREIKEQEERLISLMKKVEPLLDDNAHTKVTQLLCELTAYDIMQMFHSLQEARPKTQFRG
ncbi:MAG TPA: hypothetical protein VH592_16450 [Gemmataceae bacterium]|jgi:hypothetical protein